MEQKLNVRIFKYLNKSMKIEELLQKVKDLNLPKGQYAIFGSGPMTVRNLKDANDIDIIVTENVFNECKNKREWRNGVSTCGSENLSKEGIEILKDWGPGEWNVAELIKNAEIIDDLPFVRLEDVVRWKRVYAREKDFKDIKLIEDYLRI